MSAKGKKVIKRKKSPAVRPARVNARGSVNADRDEDGHTSAFITHTRKVGNSTVVTLPLEVQELLDMGVKEEVRIWADVADRRVIVEVTGGNADE